MPCTRMFPKRFTPPRNIKNPCRLCIVLSLSFIFASPKVMWDRENESRLRVFNRFEGKLFSLSPSGPSLMLFDSSYKCLMLFLFFFLILLIKQAVARWKNKTCSSYNKRTNLISSSFFFYILQNNVVVLFFCFFVLTVVPNFGWNGKWSWNWKGVQNVSNNSHFGFCWFPYTHSHITRYSANRSI